MEELEIGEFVRTKTGIIDKVTDFAKDTNLYHCENGLIIDSENTLATKLSDIERHSKKFTDLVKVKDIAILNCYGIVTYKFLDRSDLIEIQTGQYKILKLMTREQFQEKCFDLGK